jgi:hypothetical protein
MTILLAGTIEFVHIEQVLLYFLAWLTLILGERWGVVSSSETSVNFRRGYIMLYPS